MYLHTTRATPCTPAFSSRFGQSTNNNYYPPSPSSGYSSASTSPLNTHERQRLPQLMNLRLNPSPSLTFNMSPQPTKLVSKPRPVPKISCKINLGHDGVFKCPVKGNPLVTIECDGRFETWAYDAMTQKPQLHECVCMDPEILEAELEPMYSVFADNEYVIFALNMRTEEIGQYIFCRAKGGLVKVDRPNVIYNEGRSAYFMMIGEKKEFIQKNESGWVKQRLTETGWVVIPTVPVVLEATKRPVTKFPELMVLSCPHVEQDILVFKTLKAGRLLTYRFDGRKKEFNHAECWKCFPAEMWKHRYQETLKKSVETPKKVNKGLAFRKANQARIEGSQTPKRNICST